MKALKIEDLNVAKELDGRAMSSVRGGTLGYFHFPFAPVSISNTTNFSAEQSVGQANEILSNNGNNAAFVTGITSTVKPSQTGTNTINF
ncbi:hypothetical protein [Trinickia sp.]|uniref:hypothetical protein n=1 Tax=Trinickia sp. TaxID=2571163 RepID=UPI003F80F953